MEFDEILCVFVPHTINKSSSDETTRECGKLKSAHSPTNYDRTDVSILQNKIKHKKQVEFALLT